MIELAAERKARLVEACIVGTHAYQIMLHQTLKSGDATAFDPQGLTAEQLDQIVRAQKTLVTSDPVKVARWADSKPSAGDPTAELAVLLGTTVKLDERLPVAVATRVFAAKAPDIPPEKLRAFASLLQVVLEVDRDGEILQDLCAFYLPLGLLAGPTDFGVPDDNARFLEVATELAAASCKAPFKTTRSAWQMALRKIQNWSLKHRGIGPREYANELLQRDDIKPLTDAIQAMRPLRILVLGHSYTMKVHWSTLAPLNEIVAAVFRKLNPDTVFTQMGQGGMSASQARGRFLKAAVAWKPNRVLIVVVMNSDDDLAAMEEMTREFKEVGAAVMCFDQIYVGGETWINPNREKLLASAKKSGLAVIEVGRLLETHPERNDFLALDGVHMRPSYHKFMAAEWLKYLMGARRAELPVEPPRVQ